MTNLFLADWLLRQRWYAGRNRTLSVLDTVADTALRDDLDLLLVDVGFVDGSTQRYQLVVRWSPAPLPGLPSSALIGNVDGRWAYDGLQDPEASRHLLALCAAGGSVGDIVYTTEPGVTLPIAEPARLSGAEQSNTSVIFGNQAILKVFRRLTPGINPDIELNRALGRAGNQHVARLLAAFETSWDGQPCPLGMVTEFAAGSAEGWALATTAADSDFTAESLRLGAAVASVHHSLADEFGTSTASFDPSVMLSRLRGAAAEVPALAERQSALEHRLAAAAGQSMTLQRVHGDLHLGQVLRTPQTWLVIDFEGEPGTPVAQRRRPDSPLRDVAGMLRSYAYAAHQARLLTGSGDIESAEAWIAANRDAFCVGYASVAGTDPRAEADLLAAYELDKAIYEVGYEARYRPDWLPIPMRAIAGLTDRPTE